MATWPISHLLNLSVENRLETVHGGVDAVGRRRRLAFKLGVILACLVKLGADLLQGHRGRGLAMATLFQPAGGGFQPVERQL